MKKYNIIILFTMVLFFSFATVSCEEEQINSTADQLFRPVRLSAEVSGTDVKLAWVPIGGAKYSLEVSKDSLLFSNELNIIELDSSFDKYQLIDLWSNSRYSARIKAISEDGSLKDSGYKEITFVTGTENIFYGTATEDIGSTSVLLKWIAGKNVSHIKFAGESGNPQTVQLTEGDIQLGQKKITGLISGTTYTCMIYNGEMLRGTITITTL